MSPLAILTASLPVYLMMFVGVLFRKLKLLPNETDKGLLNLTVWLLYPSLIADRIIGNPALKDPAQVGIGAFLGFAIIACTMLIAFSVARLLRMKEGEGSRTFGLSNGMQNYGYLAIPVTEAIFDKNLIGVLFTHTLGIELAVWTLGIGLLTGLKNAPWKQALNPIVFAIIGSLVLHYSGAAAYLPKIFTLLFTYLGNCAIPISVILAGAGIADLLGKEKFQLKVAIAAPIVRLGLLAFFILCVARWFPMNEDLKKVLIVQAAMPSAVFTLVLAKLYGGHPQTAAVSILSSSFLSLFTVPWVIAFGIWFVGVQK